MIKFYLTSNKRSHVMLEAHQFFLKEIIIFFHAIGTVIAYGSVIVAHAYAFFFMEINKITYKDHMRLQMFHIIAKVGLYILVISGLLFLPFYYFFSPELLLNTKIYAKIMIVICLFVYMPYMHNNLIPLVQANTHRKLFSRLSAKSISFAIFIGIISTITWAYIFLLGTFRSFNYIATSTSSFFLALFFFYLLPYALFITLSMVISKIVGAKIYANIQHADYDLPKNYQFTGKDCLLICDATKKHFPIIKVNSSFCKFTGYKRHQVIQRNCKFLQCDKTNPDTVKLIIECLKNGKEFMGYIVNRKKNGALFSQLLLLSPIKNDDDVITHYVGIQKILRYRDNDQP